MLLTLRTKPLNLVKFKLDSELLYVILNPVVGLGVSPRGRVNVYVKVPKVSSTDEAQLIDPEPRDHRLLEISDTIVELSDVGVLFEIAYGPEVKSSIITDADSHGFAE